jgi:hypothetical protein
MIEANKRALKALRSAIQGEDEVLVQIAEKLVILAKKRDRQMALEDEEKFDAAEDVEDEADRIAWEIFEILKDLRHRLCQDEVSQGIKLLEQALATARGQEAMVAYQELKIKVSRLQEAEDGSADQELAILAPLGADIGNLPAEVVTESDWLIPAEAAEDTLLAFRLDWFHWSSKNRPDQANTAIARGIAAMEVQIE